MHTENACSCWGHFTLLSLLFLRFSFLNGAWSNSASNSQVEEEFECPLDPMKMFHFVHASSCLSHGIAVPPNSSLLLNIPKKLVYFSAMAENIIAILMNCFSLFVHQNVRKTVFVSAEEQDCSILVHLLQIVQWY
jgi:hypothetical protein